MRSRSVLIVMFTCLCCCAAMEATQEQKSEVDTILSGFPGYHLLALNERDADTRAFILKHFPKGNTSVVHADFDGDGHLDYAMLLKNDKSSKTKLVVLLCAAEAQCKSVYELDVTGYSDVVYLRSIAAGSSVSQTEAVATGNHRS